jgi:ketosteroid isomerase-like protein
MIRTLFLVIVLLFASPALAHDAKAELAAQGDLWNAAYNAGDWAAMRKLYTDDAWLMTDKAPLAKGADAIIAYLRRFRDMGAKVNFRFEPEDVAVEGKLGTVVARYWMTAELPNRPAIKTAGRSLLIYRKQGKRWLLWRDMDNTTPDVKVDAAP